MEEYKSNSHKSREAEKASEKKLEKVISGTAKKRKKSEFKKFTDVFVAEDVENVKSYILMDVLVPAVKKAISDIVTNGVDMALYGESRHQTNKSTASKVSYRNYYDRKEEPHYHDRYSSNRARTGYDYDDIILDTRGEAESVLDRMGELIETYKMASVADLYELVGMTGNYTDNKYGWTNISTASIVRIRDGYVIKMPRAMPLD